MNNSSSPLPSVDVFGYLQELNYQFTLQNPAFQGICKIFSLWTWLVIMTAFGFTTSAVLLLEGLIVFLKRDISSFAQQILCNKNVSVYILCVSWMFLDRMPVLVKACWREWLGTILWGVTAGMNSYLKLTWNRKSCCCIVFCQRERIILSLEGILLWNSLR